MFSRVEGTDVHTHDLFTENGEAQADTCGNEWKAIKGSTSNGTQPHCTPCITLSWQLHVERENDGTEMLQGARSVSWIVR